MPLFSNGLEVNVGINTMFSILIASHPIAGYCYRDGACPFNAIQYYAGKSVDECAAICTGDSTCVGESIYSQFTCKRS